MTKEGELPPCQQDPPKHFFQGFAHGGAEICLRCGYARIKPAWEGPKRDMHR